MDALDAKILRETTGGLFSGPFPPNPQSLRTIARKIGADKETVRNRLIGMQRDGILEGWRTMINPELLSLEVKRIWLEFQSGTEKLDELRKLSRIPSIRIIYDYFGNSVSFVYARRRDSEDSGELGDYKAADNVFEATLKFPKSSAALTDNDWRIYGSIRNKPNKTIVQISEETGLSTRTLKRRLGQLARQNALLVFPEVQPGMIEGVASDLLVKYSSPEGVELTLLTDAGDSVVRVERYVDSCVLFSLLTRNVTKTWEILEKVRGAPGVTDASVKIVQDLIQPKTPLNWGAHGGKIGR